MEQKQGKVQDPSGQACTRCGRSPQHDGHIVKPEMQSATSARSKVTSKQCVDHSIAPGDE